MERILTIEIYLILLLISISEKHTCILLVQMSMHISYSSINVAYQHHILYYSTHKIKVYIICFGCDCGMTCCQLLLKQGQFKVNGSSISFQ